MKPRPNLLVGLAAAACCAAGAASAAVQPLRLCADPANLPFSSNAPEAVARQAPGLYVEIGQAIAAALDRPLETVWSLSYFGKRNVRTTLLAGRCDLAIGLPALSDFMGPSVIFTRPILQLGYALVVPKGGVAASIDSLGGRKVAVQFASPPQSLLATRSDITSVTTMDPEEAMARLAEGSVDAAFIWGPSAGYINRTALNDRFSVVAVDAPQLQWPAAIGFARKQAALRDEVDSVLDSLQPRIGALARKYAVLADATVAPPPRASAAVLVAVADPAQPPASDAGGGGPPATTPSPATAVGTGDAVAGRVTFNGTCGHCHGPDAVVADRKINLRRLKAKYGQQMPEVFFKTVTNGRPDKGMPPWKEVFRQQDFADILAYLNTVQDK